MDIRNGCVNITNTYRIFICEIFDLRDHIFMHLESSKQNFGMKKSKEIT